MRKKRPLFHPHVMLTVRVVRNAEALDNSKPEREVSAPEPATMRSHCTTHQRNALVVPNALAASFVYLFFAGLDFAEAGLVNRWSFNSGGAAVNGTAFADSVSGATMQVVGANATLNGSAITLPGNTNGDRTPATIAAYLDLPNGIVSSKTNLTVEIWATPIANGSWARLVDFGRMNRSGMGAGAAAGEILPTATAAPGTTESSDSIMLALSRGGAANTQQIDARLNGGGTVFQQSSQTLNLGAAYHFVIVFQDGVGTSGASGGQLRWFLNGTLVATVDVPFRLRDIEDVNNWLGRSQWTGDSNANIALDEVRVYDHAMSAAEVSASRAAGPNSGFGPPVTLADSVTMHRNQKALVPVTANDTGLFNPATVAVVTPPQFGSAVPNGQGGILYSHTTGTPTSDSFTYTVNGTAGISSPASVNVAFSNQLRIAPGPLNVPAAPPSTNIAIVNAFPTLSFSQPLGMASPPGDTRRLFVVQKTGAIRVIPDVTAASPVISTFLSLAVHTNSECGLLGLAFHPNYAVNRYFYVFYSVRPGSTTLQRLSRFTANATNSNVAIPGSELILIEQADDADNHNGGDIHFGPDGYLYVALGDEGGQNDQYDNAQRIDRDFFAGILRIDVDKRPGNLEPTAHPAIPRDAGVARYSIPADNPWVNATSFNGSPITVANRRAEFWAVGLRNPWKISFDSQAPNEMWIGDVGGGQREEINIGTSGGNFGWAFREGTVNGPKSGSTPSGFSSLAPLYEYNHGSGTFQGNSVTGGVVARNNRFSALADRYFFADYVSGNLWSLVRNPNAQVARVSGAGGIAGFGFDPSNRDVLMANINQSQIQRLIAADVTSSFPQTLSETGLFADLSDLSPAPGLLPYTVNLPFWSDHASKRRWFVLPDPAARFTWSREGTWGAPAGGIWVKHFDLETVRGNPATNKRLETRLLVRNATGSYGVSYRWNDAGTVATLVPDEGVSFPVNVSVNSVIAPQTWSIPSRASCLSCHNAPAGHMLSFKTRQLNQQNSIHGFAGNQIDLLAQAGYFSAAVAPGDTLPRHARPNESALGVAAHVRSYLEVNCAYCHMPGGPAPSNWDAREATPLAATGLINGIANNTGGNPLNRLVVPGNTSLSVLLHRVAASNGFGRMPPIASNVLDDAAIAQIQQWISSSLPGRQDYAAWRVAKFQSSDSPAGERTSNPDGDNATNEAEFLIGTEPNSGASFPNAQITSDGNALTVSLNLPADRIAWIETSTDLVSWTRWNVPGNNGLPGPAGVRTFTGPLTLPTQFFRPVVIED